jgi:hypothetical protein
MNNEEQGISRHLVTLLSSFFFYNLSLPTIVIGSQDVGASSFVALV